jgi:hypothetical protein
MSGISSQQKQGSSKKRRKRKREQGMKSKRGETSYEEATCFKKNLQAARRHSIKGKKERRSHFPIVQNPMCGIIHTHTSFAFALPYIPSFPFLTPFHYTILLPP